MECFFPLQYSTLATEEENIGNYIYIYIYIYIKNKQAYKDNFPL